MAEKLASVGTVGKPAFDGKLIVFTSFYECRAYAPYVQSMVQLSMVLERLGIKWDYWASLGDFHIERSINEAYNRFLKDEEATDILCIDADESFSAEGVVRLLLHPEEIVAGAYRMKNSWDKWTAIWKKDEETGKPRGKILNDGTALLKAERVPWGFLRIKKPVLQKWTEQFPDKWFTGKSGKEFIFCEGGYRNREFFSQDYLFSERLKEIGYELWLDPNLTIGHWGLTNHEGNLHQHLISLNAEQEHKQELEKDPNKAFELVAQMAADIEKRKVA